MFQGRKNCWGFWDPESRWIGGMWTQLIAPWICQFGPTSTWQCRKLPAINSWVPMLLDNEIK